MSAVSSGTQPSNSSATQATAAAGSEKSEWYRLRVTAYGCNIAASAQNLRALETAWIAFKERSCIKAGHVRLRSLNAGSWRNVSISGAGLDDYRALQQHAVSVQPVILNGLAWWTPWHVAMVLQALWRLLC